MLNIFRPHQIVHRLEEVDFLMLRGLGIRGVMLDLDNTLAPWRSRQVSAAVCSWVESVQQSGLRVCMVTNAANVDRVQPVADSLGIPCVLQAIKPLRRGFLRGIRALDTTPETTAMIGDMLLTDIFGGNRLGLHTVLVNPMSRHEAWPARFIQRPIEWLIGRTVKHSTA